jgi:hypothetical protein
VPQASTHASDASTDAAWAKVHGASDLQFTPLPPWHPDPPPFWLKALGEWLETIFAPVARVLGLSWPMLQWLIYGLLALGIALLIWRIAAPLWTERRRRAAPEASAAWTPEAAAARALLEDADRLAAQGRERDAWRIGTRWAWGARQVQLRHRQHGKPIALRAHTRLDRLGERCEFDRHPGLIGLGLRGEHLPQIQPQVVLVQGGLDLTARIGRGQIQVEPGQLFGQQFIGAARHSRLDHRRRGLR